MENEQKTNPSAMLAKHGKAILFYFFCTGLHIFWFREYLSDLNPGPNDPFRGGLYLGYSFGFGVVAFIYAGSFRWFYLKKALIKDPESHLWPQKMFQAAISGFGMTGGFYLIATILGPDIRDAVTYWMGFACIILPLGSALFAGVIFLAPDIKKMLSETARDLRDNGIPWEWKLTFAIILVLVFAFAQKRFSSSPYLLGGDNSKANSAITKPSP